MPYIAYDLDAKKRVPHVARALGVPEHQAGWGLLNLWEWCWTEKTDVARQAHFAGFFGAAGPAVAEALEAFGFIEAAEEGNYRIRGADRYLRLAAARSAGGKAAAGNLRRGTKPGASPAKSRKPAPAAARLEPRLEPGASPGCGPALTPSTEHLLSSSSKTTAKEREEKQTDPRHAPLVKILVEAFQRLVGASYAFTGRDALAVSKLLALGQPDDVAARWERALRHQGFPSVKTLPELVQHWNHFATDRPAKPSRGRASEADKDWSTYEPNAEAF